MPTCVALLRPVNVGGRFVTTAALREAAGHRELPPDAVARLDAHDQPGERCPIPRSELLAEPTKGSRRTTMTNARIELITGRTTTWRDLEVARTLDEKWGT